MAVRILETKTNFKQYMQTTNLAKPSVNPFPAFRALYEVCSKVHSVEFVCCYRMLNTNFLRKFQRLVHSEVTSPGVLRMNIFGFFNISLRLL